MAGEDPSKGPEVPGLQIPTSVTGKPIMAAWSQPLQPGDSDGKDMTNQRPTISTAVASIKKEDFTNVVNTPCARNGFMTGIVTGAAAGGLKVVVRGNWSKAANWAVGMFIVGAMGSYEYCQYQRRVEKRNMKRAVEVHAESIRQKEKLVAEQKELARKAEEERKAAAKRWYKFW